MHEYPDIAALTRRYARFSISAGGLASVLGGALAIVAYFVGALLPPVRQHLEFREIERDLARLERG